MRFSQTVYTDGRAWTLLFGSDVRCLECRREVSGGEDGGFWTLESRRGGARSSVYACTQQCAERLMERAAAGELGDT